MLVRPPVPVARGPVRVDLDWDALEIAVERNSPDTDSYLDFTSGRILTITTGDPEAVLNRQNVSDNIRNFLRIEPASSREQYRWMERFIPLVEEDDLRGKLGQAIDGKGAFRRFKDVLMSYAEDREKWFTFRSERLRTFMEAWLTAHAINATPRPTWNEGGPESEVAPESAAPSSAALLPDGEGPKSSSGRRARNAETSRQQLKELAEALGPRDLDTLVSFAEFLKARRAARGFAHHTEHMAAERESKRTLVDSTRSDEA